MAKPDDRSDNVEKISNAVQNTVQNLDESEEYLAEHADELGASERQQLNEKNENRRQSIRNMRSEIRDEAQAND